MKREGAEKGQRRGREGTEEGQRREKGRERRYEWTSGKHVDKLPHRDSSFSLLPLFCSSLLFFFLLPSSFFLLLSSSFLN
jgi:hypothetical protein